MLHELILENAIIPIADVKSKPNLSLIDKEFSDIDYCAIATCLRLNTELTSLHLESACSETGVTAMMKLFKVQN